MDFLIYGRRARNVDDPGGNQQLNEAHWSYMDAFAGRMTARGPTLSQDRQTWTGSLHVVALPNAEAARGFAENDPYHRAGLFSSHLIRAFDNRLGRTMWDFAPQGTDLPFLVIADSEIHRLPQADAVAPPGTALGSALQDRLIMWGTLRPVDARQSSGVALALVAPDLAAVQSLIADQPALLGSYADPEIHAWEFGGRR
jgi:uncharacterized protein YciI